MRIIRFLLVTIIFLLLSGAATYFAGREILLLVATAQVRSSLTSLRTASRNTGAYLLECRQKLSESQLEQPIDALQLRFTSDTTYQVEVVCQRFYNDPIILAEEQLPPLVKKIPGYSGFVWDEKAETVLGLEVLGRQKFMVVSEGNVTQTNTAPEPIQGPITSCNGYGFTCCNPDTSQGVGSALTTAMDCPATCFSACAERPAVLSLTTEPFYDPQTRTLAASAGAPIMFNYLATGDNTAPVQVKIEYGDGQADTSSDLTGQFTHTYDCQQAQCQFTATISITNDQGITSIATPLSQVKVLVSR